MEKYMFLFGGGNSRQLSGDAMQAHMQKWIGWVQKLQEQKRYVSGEALQPGGKKIVGPKKTVTDGPFAEGKEVVGGFFVVYATNIKDAVEMAKECPDYELGGEVEIREVQKMDM